MGSLLLAGIIAAAAGSLFLVGKISQAQAAPILEPVRPVPDVDVGPVVDAEQILLLD